MRINLMFDIALALTARSNGRTDDRNVADLGPGRASSPSRVGKFLHRIGRIPRVWRELPPCSEPGRGPNLNLDRDRQGSVSGNRVALEPPDRDQE